MRERADTLRRYLDLLLGSLDEPVDGSELARRAFLSRFHLDRVIRLSIGEPPAALRRRVLLERAAWTLANSERSVTDVGLAAGYETPSAFARAFTRAYGRAPSTYRSSGGHHWLPAPNSIHFHPPAGLVISERRDDMDITDRLVEHDLWLTRRILERAAPLSDAELDRPLMTPTITEVSSATLRELLERLVFTKETWTASLRGEVTPDRHDASIPGLLTRLDEVEPSYRAIVRDIRARGHWDDSYVDTECDPPVTFTYGGAVAHVITFSAFRRVLALAELRARGIDLGYGDPIEWEREQIGGV